MHSRTLVPLAALLLLAPLARAADTTRGDELLAAHFRHQVRQISEATLADLTSRDDWEKRRPELRRQFLDMMGLWPLPPRTDLKATVTGSFDVGEITIEKIHFQSVPGLYVTGNLYRPKKVTGPLPGVLYVCGHGPSIIDGVSYGNKVTYQHHGAWLAEHGYVCLMIDTLQLGELQGLHHGTHHLGMWWWQSLGYTPAGIECWNGVRALDYLQTRPEVNAKRLGVTGRSGGGATSWWVAAADDRVSCIIPVAGIGDLHAHLVEGLTPAYRKGVISGHCDCMYFVNTYRWDFATVAALCAPRALLLGNSDADAIFPVPGYRRLADKVRRVYDLYGAADRFALLETKGPHKDTPELRAGAYRWLNRWLKQDKGDVAEREWAKLPPQRLKVLDRAPADAINATVHETFLRPAVIELPQSPAVVRSWWEGKREELKKQLKERSFGGWPSSPPPLDAKPAGDVTHDGLRLRAFDYTSEPGVSLRVWLLTAAGTDRPTKVIIRPVDEAGWDQWARALGPAFREPLLLAPSPTLDEKGRAALRQALDGGRAAVAVVAPRGIGPTRWAEAGTPADNHVRRRFALVGQTLDGQRIWDLRRALAVLRERPEAKGVPQELHGQGEAAGLCVYASFFEPDVARFDLKDLSPSLRQGPTLLNAWRVLDMPQALALLAPRPVTLRVSSASAAKSWAWTLQFQQSQGAEFVKIHRMSD